MREVIIETEVQYQLAELKDYLIEIQGDKKGKKTFSEIIAALDSMEYFGDVGSNISERFNIDCPSNWFLYYIHKNYFVFSKTDSTITILKMYDNRQDFIYDLFGVEMRSQESKDYWGELGNGNLSESGE